MRHWSIALTALVLCLIAGVSLQTQVQPPAAARPNVVLIMSDDMGYGDLSSYGATDLRTPNIDSIGRDGIRLTDFYANGVLCSPTRAGLITGRYQQRYAIESALGDNGMVGLIATGRSLPQLVKNNGYATALVGKWHLGTQPEFTPKAHGFDYFYGFIGSHVDYYQHNRGPMVPDLWENDQRITSDRYMTDLITEKSLAFIEQNAARPFFIDIAYNAPHWPYQPPDKPSVAAGNARHVMPQENTGTRGDYVSMVERVDQGVGQILRTLDRLNLSNNTIVIFTNDNGGEWLSNNHPLSNRKWTTWEGGIRVPALVRWPGRIPAGRVSGQVGITMDLAASILAATNSPVPADAKLDGVNLLPILQGQAPEVERTIFWRTNAGNRTQRAVRSGDWKVMVDANHVFVYNLRADISERDDLASKRQDIAQRLRPLLAQWETAVDTEARETVPQFAAQVPAAGGRGGAPGAGRGAAPGAGRGGGAPGGAPPAAPPAGPNH